VEDKGKAKAKGASKALQFGHGGEAVEDYTGGSCKSRLPSRLQFGHGGEAVEDSAARRCRSSAGRRRFNSATAVKPWKTAVLVGRWECANGLQFGHGGEAVEDLHPPPPAGQQGTASIRPRR